MTDNEYIEKYCKNCKNRNNDEDLCNIVTNIDGEPQCVNYEKENTIISNELRISFIINNHRWRIYERDLDEMIKRYKEINKGKEISYIYGYTYYPVQEIWINKELSMEQKIKTLKHELTHCYIWEYGLYFAEDVTEDMICDLVSCSNNFINEVVREYIKKYYN